MFNRLSVSAKMLCATVLVVVCAGILATVALSSMAEMGDLARQAEQESAYAEIAGQIQNTLVLEEALFWRSIAAQTGMVGIDMGDIDQIGAQSNAYLASFDAATALLLDGGQTDLGAIPPLTDPRQVALVQAMQAEKMGNLEVLLGQLTAISDDQASGALSAAEASARQAELNSQIDESLATLVADAQEIQQTSQANANAALKASDTTSTAAITLSTVTIAIGVAVLVIVMLLIIRSITAPIRRVTMSLGNAADQVSTASNQIAQSAQEQASTAGTMASGLEETSSSLEEMASMTKQNAANSRQADAMVRQAYASASKGVTAVSEMSQVIGKIKDSADSTARIVKTIDNIAFQTNILALNAAVEAARAGEAGKGFAVVAEEVRNLAQRSAEAAKTTSELIEESQANAEGGVKVSREVEGILKEIAVSVDKVTSLVAEVSAASEEQAQGIEQINAAMAEMDRAIQGGAAGLEESASSAEEMSAQAFELTEMVFALGLISEGAKRAEKARAEARGRASANAASTTTQALPGQQHYATSAPALRRERLMPLNDNDLKDF